MPQSNDSDRGYNIAVRFYTTKPVNGGIVFTCVFCPHSVTTLNFKHSDGNCRTQAASAMNQHATDSHAAQMHEMAPVKVNSY